MVVAVVAAAVVVVIVVVVVVGFNQNPRTYAPIDIGLFPLAVITPELPNRKEDNNSKFDVEAEGEEEKRSRPRWSKNPVSVPVYRMKPRLLVHATTALARTFSYA